MGKKSRDKGRRRETEIVNLFKSWGLDAKRVGTAYTQGHDVDVFIPGRAPALIGEVKARADGFKQLYAWLEKDGADYLALKADNKDWLIVIPERVLRELIT